MPPDHSSASTAAAPAPSQTISLNDLGQKYLGALQGTFDTAAFLIEGVREVRERDYDETVASVRFLPSQSVHRGYDAAKEVAERWLLKNLLTDGLATIIPFLEDVRSIAALADWKASGSTDQTILQKILTEERQRFLNLDLAAKFAVLKEQSHIESPLAPQIEALVKLGTCIVAREGVVAPEDANEEGALAFTVVALQIVPLQTGGEHGGPTLSTQVGQLPRRFAIGERVRLEKADYLNIIVTLSIFATSILKGLQEVVTKSQAGQAPA